jgi:hypothetical protein
MTTRQAVARQALGRKDWSYHADMGLILRLGKQVGQHGFVRVMRSARAVTIRYGFH